MDKWWEYVRLLYSLLHNVAKKAFEIIVFEFSSWIQILSKIQSPEHCSSFKSESQFKFNKCPKPLVRLIDPVRVLDFQSGPDWSAEQFLNDCIHTLKFIYLRRPQKFAKSPRYIWPFTTYDKSTVEISQKFVAFSEYMNFTRMYFIVLT